MAVKIRLNRLGTKKRPFYRLVAIDSRAPQNGRHIEMLGTYDPLNISIPADSNQKAEKGIVNFKTDRILYWLSVGAVPTPTVKTILKRLKLKASDKKAA